MAMTSTTNKDQPSFLNYLQDTLGPTRTGNILDRIDQVVPWNALEKKVWQ
jgi:hypothetical protein